MAMAEEIKDVCPFYLNSSCRDGDRCKYTHDSTCSSRKNVACCFFLKGSCKFGDSCRYLHSKVEDSFNSMSLNDLQKVKDSCQLPTENRSPKYPINKVDAVHSEYKLPSINSDKSSCDPNFFNWVNAQDSRQLRENRSPQYPVNKVDVVHSEYNLPYINSVKSSCDLNSPNWVNAPEFEPLVNQSCSDVLKSDNCVFNSTSQKLDMEMCTYYSEGMCPYKDDCPYIHGDKCELCKKYCLNPFSEMQRKLHIENCEKELEENMEFSFAFQRSLDKTCGICMDVVMEKDPVTERVFGILENCNHIYCLSCIRKWRTVESFEVAQHVEQLVNPVVTRACPECRVSSHFITPSRIWVDTEKEKKKLIAEYKLSTGKKPCKYFKQGKGTCPFGGACFYLHANSDGTKVDLPLPSRRRRQNQDGE